MTVKTYDCAGCHTYCYGGYHMEDAGEYGDYVEKKDYDEAVARIAQLEEALKGAAFIADTAGAEIRALKARLDAEAVPVPDFKNCLTAYGMLVRSLRIVANTTLYDMGKALSLKPSTLSSMEFGRVPVTLETVCETAAFFESLGVDDTLPVLHAALRASSKKDEGHADQA